MKKILAVTLLSSLILSNNGFTRDLWTIERRLRQVIREIQKLQRLSTPKPVSNPDGVVRASTTLYAISDDCNKITAKEGGASDNFEFTLRKKISCPEKAHYIIRSATTGNIFMVNASDAVLY